MLAGHRHGNSQGFVLVDLVAQSSDGNLEISSRTGAGPTVKSKRPQNEFALNVFNCVTDKPRNDQPVNSLVKVVPGLHLPESHAACAKQ